MTGDVVDMAAKTRHGPIPPFVSDFWFAQIDARLNKIEFVIGRMERQVWIIVFTSFAALGFEVFRAVVAVS